MDSASPQLSSRELLAGETYSQYRERISKKEGFRVAIYWITGDVYKGEWSDDKRHGECPAGALTCDLIRKDWWWDSFNLCFKGVRIKFHKLAQDIPESLPIFTGYVHTINCACTRSVLDVARTVMRNGTGTHLYKSGNRYEGQFIEGKREGHGTFWVIDNDTKTYRPTYRGHWKNNLWHGPGLLYGLCGEIYVGSFEYGKRSGCGKQTYREWMDEKDVFHVYNGEWDNNKRNGVGTLTMVNGNVYIGHWVDDVKEGLGVFYYKDKESKYEGVWKSDMPVCGTYTRDVKWDPFEDMDDVLQLPPLEVSNFQKLARDCISAAWKQPLATPFEHFTSAVTERSKGTPGPLDYLI